MTTTLSFYEKLAGAFAWGETDPRSGAFAGKRAGIHFGFQGTIGMADLDKFIADPSHDATFDGVYLGNLFSSVGLPDPTFIEGAFERKEGFSMDFEAHDKEARGCKSLAAARARLKRCYDRARSVIGRQTSASLLTPLPPGPVMGGAPRLAIVGGIEDHTAHHRGALTVYARLLDRVPPMPYMDPM